MNELLYGFIAGCFLGYLIQVNRIKDLKWWKSHWEKEAREYQKIVDEHIKK